MFNIFFLAFIAIGFGLILAIFITRSKKDFEAQVIPEEDAERNPSHIRALNFSDLKRLATQMCSKNALTVKEEHKNSDFETYLVCESKNDFFYGHYVIALFISNPMHPYISLHDLLEFKDFVKSVSSTKGFYLTSGYFARDVHQPLEGPKISLYNRKRIIEELELEKGEG